MKKSLLSIPAESIYMFDFSFGEVALPRCSKTAAIMVMSILLQIERYFAIHSWWIKFASISRNRYGCTQTTALFFSSSLNVSISEIFEASSDFRIIWLLEFFLRTSSNLDTLSFLNNSNIRINKYGSFLFLLRLQDQDIRHYQNLLLLNP